MVKQIDVQALKAMIDAGEPVHLVDVREPWEHALAHLPGAQLLPLGELAERVDEVHPAQGALVVVYCHHGVRSLDGAYLLARAGLRAVSLAGGIERWSTVIDPTMPRY